MKDNPVMKVVVNNTKKKSRKAEVQALMEIFLRNQNEKKLKKAQKQLK